MQYSLKQFSRYAVLALCMFVPVAFAHQPRIPEQTKTIVDAPEISKAYYAKLTGEPQVYAIEATGAFDLYINILVPDLPGQNKDVTATLIKNHDTAHPIAILGGVDAPWKYMFEPFGYDAYWQSSEYKVRAEAWTYEVLVTSPRNDSKYSLAIGEIENFDLRETINALSLVPKLKRDFFLESPMNFIFSPLGWWAIVILLVLAFAFGWVLRVLLRQIPRLYFQESSRKISPSDRGLRVVVAMAFLLFAVSTTWSLVLIFMAGYILFEGVFGWSLVG